MIKRGCYRIVFLLGRYAVKIPNVTDGLELFLKGMLCNMQEAGIWKYSKDPRLCPVLFGFYGLLLIMPRATDLTVDEWSSIDPRAFIDGPGDITSIPVEAKMQSFGKLGELIVAIDYGSGRNVTNLLEALE